MSSTISPGMPDSQIDFPHTAMPRPGTRMPGQVLAQFIYIHPGREAAVGGVILCQGTQFPDFLEQCGNRLEQVVECNGLFCFVHCLQGLSETMASHFVATEKETRLPLWKSGRKVGIIKWADLESSFFFLIAVQKIITIFAEKGGKSGICVVQSISVGESSFFLLYIVLAASS